MHAAIGVRGARNFSEAPDKDWTAMPRPQTALFGRKKMNVQSPMDNHKRLTLVEPQPSRFWDKFQNSWNHSRAINGLIYSSAGLLKHFGTSDSFLRLQYIFGTTGELQNVLCTSAGLTKQFVIINDFH